jgi:chromosome partitioning protein
VAKTTSAMYLAGAYARRANKEARVLDADPQSSASLWRDLAEENGEGLEGVRVEPANLSTLQRLRRTGGGGFAVVDAPPQGRLLEASIQAADFVVVPTSDSPLDLQQAWATIDAIPQGRRAAVLVVRAETGTKAYAETIRALDGAGTPRFDAVVRKRQDIKKSMGHSPAKAWEYAQVLDELLEALR